MTPRALARPSLIAMSLAAGAIVLIAAACSKREAPTPPEAGAGQPAEAAGHDRTESGGMAMAPGFAVDPRRQQLIGVTYGSVERRSVARTVRTVGTVTYDESRLADATLKFHGWIEQLRVDRTGALVQRGDVLFTLYSPELVATQEEYLTAFQHHRRLAAAGHPQAVEGARKLLEAARQRLAYWDIDPRHLRELEETGDVVRALPIHAPASGYVIEKHVVEGSHVQAGQMLYRIADLDRVWVLADIYEYELPLVSPGQRATVSLGYLPGVELTGTVAYIYPYLESAERTVKIRIELPNRGHRLKAEMYANVTLAATRSEVLTVPEGAVLDSGARKVVFIDLGEGRFEPREVSIGGLFDGYYELLGGLDEGTRIVTSANFLLDSESQLAAGMKQMQH